MAKANAYSLFVYDVARRRKAAGDPNCQVSFLFKELDSEWRNLPEAQKQKYKDRAKSSTSLSSADQWGKSNETPVESMVRPRPSAILGPTELKMEIETKPVLTTTSNKRPHDGSYSISEQDKKKLKPGIPNWKNIKNTNIEDPIKYLDKHLYDLREQCQSILRSRGDKLISTPIYTFSANVLCKQKKDGEEIFVPLELCIRAYSIKNGYLGNPYHVMVDAGPVPTNCLNAAMDHSENHKISFPPNQKGYPPGARKDYKKIYKEMLDYTKAGERTILIFSPRELAQVKGCLEWIHKKGMEEPGTKLAKVSTWTILPVAEFVVSMYNCIWVDMLSHDRPLLGLYYYVTMHLEASTMDYNTNIMCEYHKKEENQTKWCAQSCASKMIGNIEPILERICELYEIYRRSKEPFPPTFVNMMPNALLQPLQQQQQPPFPISQGAPVEQTSLKYIEQPQQPILAIQDKSSVQDQDSSVCLDPRMRGRLQPVESTVSSITPRGIVVPDCNPIGPNVQMEQQPHKTDATKKDEPLIIASSGGVIYEHPPDIF